MNEQTNEISHYIAKRLREKRQAAKLNRVAMAYQSDISLVQLRNYESGRSKISAAHLYQCAHTMGVDINYFFKGLKNLTRRIPSTQDNAIQKGQSCALNVLLIEDNDACIYLTRRAFESSSHAVTLNVMDDYECLFSFLRKQTPSLPFPHPDIIILDLNLPKVDGISILREIKQDDALSDIPVIILSNSTNVKDMITCYQEQASGYMQKPFDIDVLETNIDILAHYWAHTVVLPKRENEVVFKSA